VPARYVESTCYELCTGRTRLTLMSAQWPGAVSPDGRLMAMVGQQTNPRFPTPKASLLDLDRGEAARSFSEGAAEVVLSFDGKMAAGKAPAGPVLVWETATGKLLARFPGHPGGAALTFSPDGARLISSGRDASLLVWDVSAHRPAAAPEVAPPGPALTG